MDSDSYKRLKEDFVSNLSGTSMLEISALSFLFPAFLLLFKCHQVSSGAEMHRKEGVKTHLFRNLIVEFTFIVIPTLSVLTILNEKVYLLTSVLFCGLASTIFMKRKHFECHETLSKDKNWPNSTNLQFLSSYRFIVMLVTCLSILSVDFNIFPRRYAKAETYGTGLMDVGVGSFVTVNAIVSRKARGISELRGNTVGNTAPLIVLGFARLLSTKQVDYQVHVGEYGVHWNFFFTLAAVTLLTSIVEIPAHLSGIAGGSILIAYQFCLLGHLNNFLNSAERGSNLITQNKEGIFSLFGYWGLYLLGIQLGHFLFKSRKRVGEGGLARLKYMISIWSLTVLFWFLAWIFDRFVEKTSRRSGIGVLVVSDAFPNMNLLTVERIFTENMLATFLIANVLTGLVNLSINTIFAPASMAFGVLLLYALVLLLGMGIINSLKIKIKV
ncbi:hypothetical protein KP509_01G103000 [Ceratopteris richardii]|uniref:GPI-anchored wall transfer protein n=2 Tax=Ceratopteris richardii TaxID=49495 RepID=A0A8T2VP94_CERRI|nr:hypothetical protein KP509_01G103000 [Ceratopteris richardii]